MEAANGEVERLVTTAKVVEYLEPVMSRDLLCKFPDSTAFGFNYSQSSIWSPLIPRAHVPVDSASIVTPKKLSYGSGAESKLRSNRKKIAASAVKISPRVMQKSRGKMMKMKRNRTPNSRAQGLSPTPVEACACFPLAAEVNDRKLLLALELWLTGLITQSLIQSSLQMNRPAVLLVKHTGEMST